MTFLLNFSFFFYQMNSLAFLYFKMEDKEALVSNCSRAGDEVPPSTFSMMNIDEDRLSFHTSTDGYGYLLATLCSFIAYLFILYTDGTQ
ncbi:hypothetical protein GLYMA_15G240132v4 [Glycine max]|nr:hypothetical protein GLYMA_15G240132v4 [Glycine max]